MTDCLLRTLHAWEKTFGEITKTVPDHKDDVLEALMMNMKQQSSPD
jgi:hypothetical protein